MLSTTVIKTARNSRPAPIFLFTEDACPWLSYWSQSDLVWHGLLSLRRPVQRTLPPTSMPVMRHAINTYMHCFLLMPTHAGFQKRPSSLNLPAPAQQAKQIARPLAKRARTNLWASHGAPIHVVHSSLRVSLKSVSLYYEGFRQDSTEVLQGIAAYFCHQLQVQEKNGFHNFHTVSSDWFQINRCKETWFHTYSEKLCRVGTRSSRWPRDLQVQGCQ